MPFTTGSKVTATLAAPGGLQLNGIYDTTQTSVLDIVNTFGRQNLNEITQNIQAVNSLNQVTNSGTRTLLRGQGTVQGATRFATFSRIHESILRSAIMGRLTGSLTPTQAASVTSSATIELEPARSSSQHPNIRALYRDTGSGDQLVTEVSIDDYLVHEKASEGSNLRPTLWTGSYQGTSITFIDTGFQSATDAVNNSDGNFTDNNKVLNDVFAYTTAMVDEFMDGDNLYWKQKGAAIAYLISKAGRIMDIVDFTVKDNKIPQVLELEFSADFATSEDEVKDKTFNGSKQTLFLLSSEYYTDSMCSEKFNGRNRYFRCYSTSENIRIGTTGTALWAQRVN